MNIDESQVEREFPYDPVEDAIADFTINESRKNMVWINYIALIAQAAPMLGLFGTVYGMVNAFGILSATGAADPAELAGDIQVHPYPAGTWGPADTNQELALWTNEWTMRR